MSGLMSNQFADITDYDGLIEAFRAAKALRGLSDSMVDELGGLTRGHSEKVLGPSQTKGLSPMMLETLLGVFAVKLQMVVDVEAFKKMEGRWQRRAENHVRENASRVSIRVIERARPHVLREMATKAARARWDKHRSKMASPPLVPTNETPFLEATENCLDRT